MRVPVGAVLVGFVLFDEPEFDGRAGVVPFFTNTAVHIALVAPVEELGVGAKDFKAGVGVVVFLDDVVELGVAVLETGRWVVINDLS